MRIVSEGVNALRSKDRAMLVITHYQRLLNYIVPDKVHVMADGTIRKTGGKELALELEKTGYAELQGQGGVDDHRCSEGPLANIGNGHEMTVAVTRTKAEQAFPRTSRLSPRSCRAAPPWPRRARPPSAPSRRSACRTGASRSGSIPICAAR